MMENHVKTGDVELVLACTAVIAAADVAIAQATRKKTGTLSLGNKIYLTNSFFF
jgi:hypothetical protein